MDYKDTLNLPKTDFAMKADLVTREPQRLAKWQQANLYSQIQSARTGAPKFVLHDGPPFANGDVHVGTALNKILKDIIVKYKSLRGFDAPYVPGWDCHGLPIESKVTQELREKGNTAADAATIRTACDTYARKYIGIQREQFKRLGVFGDWENPYLTLNKEYEADELRMFADIVEKGFVYRGKKPVYWSIPFKTALAEAEVEYNDHVSQSIYVRFKLKEQPNTFVVIWTTTPWTLPANLAVAFNPQFIYSLVHADGNTYLVCDALLATLAAKCKWDSHQIVRTVSPAELASLEYEHPFCNRTGKLFPAPFVDNTTGTGFVHIAPGHGTDDYNLGRSLGLPIYSPVDDDGCLAYTNDLPQDQQMPAEMIGKSTLEKHGESDANRVVLHELRTSTALLAHEHYHHQYPHCWRSKTPIIFRAMDQWFIRVDHEVDQPTPEEFLAALEASESSAAPKFLKNFRKLALGEIDHVKWVPDWGMNRIKGAVESRPDWCISRQRTWGVPIPAFYDQDGNPILDAHVIRNVAGLMEKEGSNVWFARTAPELWALVKPVGWTGPDAVAKSNDTLDVWIDSGSSSRSVLMRRHELKHGKQGADDWQADVYLEGSDQHRGWFQSSLLLSLAGNGVAPFKTVLTHGFMVDEDREKISKSKQGGYVKPQTAERYIKDYGADVLRLWVASQDYRNDIVVSEERLKKVGETYRGIRNALRYQLSNLYDFDPAKNTVADDKLTGLDRWILGRFAELEAEVLEAYDAYEFHVVYQKVSQFVAVELSSIYHDVIKDRMYTDPKNSERRRSSQTALHRMVTGLSQMLSPILVFTADEAWEFIPGKPIASVHEAKWEPLKFSLTTEDQSRWATWFSLRQVLFGESEGLEDKRKAKVIGKNLDGRISLKIYSDNFPLTQSLVPELRELLNVSQLDFELAPKEEIAPKVERMFGFVVTKANGQKCERCWHWETDIGANAAHPTICGRCAEAVKQAPG